MDVILVNMPFHHIRWPSIGLGLLQAILKGDGFSCRAVYGNLLYAGRLGLEIFMAGEQGWNSTFLGDWLFQRALFPDHAVEAADHLPAFSEKREGNEDDSAWFYRRLDELREESETFLKDLGEEILCRKPTIVGCSFTVTQLIPSLALLKQIKEASPQTVAMTGGPGCESPMGQALHENFPFIDFVVSGDADEIIAPLARGIQGNGLHLEVEKLPEGVLAPVHREQGYPGEGGSPWKDTFRGKIGSLEGLPHPDYDDYFETLNALPSLRNRIDPAILFETSRGCWWGEKTLCKFCGDCGAFPKYRTKSAERALREIDYLYERHHIKRFVATDNAFNPRYFDSFLPRLAERNDSFSMFFEMRPNLTKEQVHKLRRAGVTYVQVGIESLSTAALKAMSKGIQAWENIQCLKWCRQFGIFVSWFFLTRLPREEDSWNQAQADLVPLLTHFHPPNFVGFIRPDRYSLYYRDAPDYGLDIRPKERYVKLFALPPDKVARFAFHLEEAGISEQMSDPLDFVLRRGIISLKKEVKKWREQFERTGEPCRLEMCAEGESLVILDTRSVAVSPKHRLEGLSRDVLLACDEAPLMNRLRRRFEQRGYDRSEIEDALQDLIDRKLVLRLDGRAISLVLEAPCLDHANVEDLAVGWIDGEREARGKNLQKLLAELSLRQ